MNFLFMLVLLRSIGIFPQVLLCMCAQNVITIKIQINLLLVARLLDLLCFRSVCCPDFGQAFGCWRTVASRSFQGLSSINISSSLLHSSAPLVQRKSRGVELRIPHIGLCVHTSTKRAQKTTHSALFCSEQKPLIGSSTAPRFVLYLYLSSLNREYFLLILCCCC